MDNGISDMLNGVLSNPDALNKIMTLMPAVAQMMNNSGLSSSSNQEKIIETAAAAPPQNQNADMTAENLLANAEVEAALKNLLTAINSASGEKTDNITNNADKTQSEEKPEAVKAFAPVTLSAEKIPDSAKIEKTLDTLKNFSSATSPENDHRSRLLLALKPFMKDERKTKIDIAIKYMNAAKLINLFGKNGYV